jgi:hypothetical protein
MSELNGKVESGLCRPCQVCTTAIGREMPQCSSILPDVPFWARPKFPRP